MANRTAKSHRLNHHRVQDVLQLLTLFATWKLILTTVLLLAPGPGYDTSSGLLFNADNPGGSAVDVRGRFTAQSLVLKFIRWDAVYFVESARRGYLFEQEWAFGRGFPRLVVTLQKLASSNGGHESTTSIATAAIVLSNALHLLSALSLYWLVSIISPRASKISSSAPFAVAVLHIISPAGAFLSAPYSESLFSFLSTVGFILYFNSFRLYRRGEGLYSSCQTVLAGVVLSLSTSVRSNGLLNGAIFLYDGALTIARLPHSENPLAIIWRLAIIGIAGCCVGLGAVIPQVVAYREFCTSEPMEVMRPWCRDHVPSIYTWVQNHYWNVGLFRYWTFSNLPLFILATPALLIMFQSSLWTWKDSPKNPQYLAQQKTDSTSDALFSTCLRRLAVPQFLSAFLALTNYHVQIITRLSSGYPLWYIWVISESLTRKQRDKMSPLKFSTIVRWMVLYAMIQGALFASFLPPA